jgi:hypothetical protein
VGVRVRGRLIELLRRHHPIGDDVALTVSTFSAATSNALAASSTPTTSLFAALYELPFHMRAEEAAPPDHHLLCSAMARM